MSEGLQVHLASKIVVPAGEKLVDGKTVKTPERVVSIAGMSNRAIRYKTLTPDEIGVTFDEAAKMLGEAGTQRQFSILARLYQCYAMVTEYSEPTENMADPKLKWSKANAATFMATPGEWSKVFTAKDTTFIQTQYAKWHEMSADEVELLAGKEIHVAG